MDIQITLNDHGLQAAMKRAPERVTAQVELALMRGAQEIARDAKRNAPKAFSTLANSIRAKRITAMHVRVSTGTNYARSVEEGRKPGKMPGTSKGLTEWVKKKFSLVGTPLERATFAIARAIARRGIKPQPYMKPALQTNESRLQQLVKDATTHGIADAMKGAHV